MAKLFPPIVNNSTVIFYSQNGIVNITIPFSINKAVSVLNINNMTVKIKTLQSNSYFYSFENYKDTDTISYELKGDNSFLNLVISDENIVNKFKIGQFYKFQIAYINNNDIGYYSDVIIGKCTSAPTVNIINLNSNENNPHTYSYQGLYINEDITEGVYSYCFNLYNKNNDIVFTTGEQIHDSSNDENIKESIDQCFINMDFDKEVFYLEYIVTTINGLIIKSPKYTLQNSVSINMDVINPVLKAVSNNEEAYIEVEFKGSPKGAAVLNTNFIIQRSNEDSNYLKWEDCYRFSIHENNLNIIWKDYTIANGVKYKYAISQYNDENVYSEKVYSDIVESNFEHLFLYDGEKQLKICYNPKISSFKIKNLENKIETMGSQHPFIIKNGKVNYKEFPISGLISYTMDPNFSFFNFNNNFFRTKTLAFPFTFKKINLNEKGEYSKNKFYRLNPKPYSYKSCDLHYNEAKDLILYKKQYNKIIDMKEEDYQKNIYYLKTGYKDFSLCDKEYSDNLVLYELSYYETTIDKSTYTKGQYYIRIENPKYILCNMSYEDVNKNNIELFVKTNNAPEINNYIDLTADNIYKEQQFKMKVLNWLTDGKPKLFKSATEGNYLIRLLNVSLTPNDTLGRMLHTFSGTAYEIAECTYENINNLGILTVDNTKEYINNYWKSIRLDGMSLNKNILQVPEVNTIDFTDMNPGTQIEIIFKSGDVQIIQIGVTGKYLINYDIPIVSIKLLNETSDGILTYSFKEKQENNFISYSDSNLINVTCRQFIGEYQDLIELLTIKLGINKIPKIELYKLLKIKILKREVVSMPSMPAIDLIQTLDKSILYKINDKYYDFSKGDDYKEYEEYNPTAILGNTEIKPVAGECFEWDVYNEQEFVQDLINSSGKEDNKFRTGNGVIVELSYILKDSIFKIESQPIYKVLEKKNDYNDAIQSLEEFYKSLPEEPSINDISKEKEIKQTIKTCYEDYISTLEKELENEKRINGTLDQDK